VTPLPVWLHVLGGLALGLLGLRGLAWWARRGGAWLVLGSLAALAAGIDAVRVLAWRNAEAERSLPTLVPVALIAALALARIVREWRGLGGVPGRPAEKTSRPS